MRHHLDGLAEIVATALLVDDRLVDAACRHGVGFGGTDAGETLVMTEVEVGLHTVYSDIALAVLVGIEGSGVNVDVRVKLLDGNTEASGLQQFADRSGDNTFTE